MEVFRIMEDVLMQLDVIQNQFYENNFLLFFYYVYQHELIEYS